MPFGPGVSKGFVDFVSVDPRRRHWSRWHCRLRSWLRGATNLLLKSNLFLFHECNTPIHLLFRLSEPVASFSKPLFSASR